MSRTQTPCPACTQARALIQHVAAANNGPASIAEELVDVIPSILESALSQLLVEFDYEANIDSCTGSAARLVAMCVEQLERAQPGGQMRERILRPTPSPR